jgi:Calcineurin-like phosphoesterase
VARTIWIGDVHGCADELSDLLDRLGPVAGDQVVFVGDLLARGPNSLGVLRTARTLGALSVRGNHEHRMLLARAARKSGERPPRLGASHQRLLDELGPDDWGYLEKLPLSLEFADHNVRVVHAGVAPNLSFEEQQAWTLLHIRSLTTLGAPSDRFSPVSWAKSYHSDPHIVFGHNAQAGLQLESAATGLDTACVYGGSLTALVLEQGSVPPPAESRRDVIVSVPARERYVGTGPRTD